MNCRSTTIFLIIMSSLKGLSMFCRHSECLETETLGGCPLCSGFWGETPLQLLEVRARLCPCSSAGRISHVTLKHLFRHHRGCWEDTGQSSLLKCSQTALGYPATQLLLSMSLLFAFHVTLCLQRKSGYLPLTFRIGNGKGK